MPSACVPRARSIFQGTNFARSKLKLNYEYRNTCLPRIRGAPVVTIDRAKALEFLRYLVIGGLNTACALAVYWGCLLMGLPYWFASGASLCFGVVLGHFSHSRLVFKQKSDFTKYATVWLAIYLLNVALLSVVRRWTGDYVAAIVLLPLNVAVSYLAMRLVVFRQNR